MTERNSERQMNSVQENEGNRQPRETDPKGEDSKKDSGQEQPEETARSGSSKEKNGKGFALEDKRMEQAFQKEMQEVRQEIDTIDQAIIPLLIRRMDCSAKVAEIKGRFGKPVLDPVREAAILERIRAKGNNAEGFDQGGPQNPREAGHGESLAAIYAGIMAVSRARQYSMMETGEDIRKLVETAPKALRQGTRDCPVKLVCQGVSGAYAHRAAKTLFPSHEEIEFCSSFREVFERVETGAGEYGVLPVENSDAGAVSEVYDLMVRYRHYAVGTVDIPIRHCLAAANPDERIHTVVSHPQALRQCSKEIARQGWAVKEFPNTAMAAEDVKERPGFAAICSLEAARSRGLHILRQGIQNSPRNTTRFVVIAKQPVIPPDADKISLCFSLPHTTGSLYHVLERFAVHGLNLTKIESVPLPHGKFEYDFYLDFTGNMQEKGTLNLICSLREELPRFSFLGNYAAVIAPAMTVGFRRVETSEQLEITAEIARRAWHDSYDGLLPKGQPDYMIEQFQSKEAIGEQIREKGYVYQWICWDQTPVGYFALVPDWEKKGELLLSKLYLLRQYQGQGIIRQVFRRIREEAKDLGMKRIWLTVNRKNQHAWKVYEHVGFLRCGEAVSDIGGGYVMDDFLYEWFPDQ